MRHDVVVSEGGDDGYGRTTTKSLLENIDEFLRHHLIEANNFVHCSRDSLVLVMAGRVAGPKYEINVALQIPLNPTESRIDKGHRGITIRPISPKVSGRSMASMTIFFARRPWFVVKIGMGI